jgi:hypothetical protein
MPMSSEERDLLELQTQLLEQAQEASNSVNALNELLMPILLQESGYEVEYGTKQVGNPAYNKTKRQLKRWEEYVGSKKGLELGSKEVKAAVRRVEELKAKLADIPKTIDQRAVVGLTRADDPARDMREENEQLLLERQNAALRGELPVSPALLSDLDQQEEDLRASLMENLGTGYETSTPGIEAMAKFGEHRNAILEATRRDDIAGAGNLANQMGGFMDSLVNSRTNRGMTAGSMPFMNSSNLLNISNGAMGPMQYMQGNRALDFQISQANNSPSGLESLLYQGAGTASTFGLGKLFGVF